MDARIVALAHVKTKIAALEFCPVTNTLVTVGPSHLSFWSHEDDTDSQSLAASGNALLSKALNANGGADLNGTIGGTPLRLRPKAAGVLPKFRDSNFVGACYDENGVCYVVTENGVLCSVESMSRMMTKWLELDTPAAMVYRAQSTTHPVRVGCCQSLVRGALQNVPPRNTCLRGNTAQATSYG